MAENHKKGMCPGHSNTHHDNHKCLDSKKIKNSDDPCAHGCTAGSGKIVNPRHLRSKFFNVYKGKDDWHLPIFRAVKAATGAQRVFYPGCDKHLTTSLVFPQVVYLDFYVAMVQYYSDPGLLEWVDQNKEYASKAEVTFYCKNYKEDFGEKPNSFDLMISASAGLVSQECSKYIKEDGYLLANDAHYDARQAFVDPCFKLVAVFDDDEEKLIFQADVINDYFKTTMGEMITQEHVTESVNNSKKKRSFKLVKEAKFYLFQKIK